MIKNRRGENENRKRGEFSLLKVFLIFVSLFVFSGKYALAQTVLKFDFGGGKVEKDYTQVTEKDIYTAEKGFGFEPNQSVNCLDRNDKNALRSDFCTADKPFYFSAKVSEGNYKITVAFGDENEATETTVKAELRRLMLENIATKKGAFVEKTFIVNVRTPHFSGGEVKLKDREKTTEWWAWDEKLTLEFNGRRPTIDSLVIEKIENVPTVFLLGDSTVCDQPGEPYASWGQMLPRFFEPTIAVANHAESGESLKSSFGARRLEKVLSLLKKGDYVFIQFGHNDEKEKGEAVGAFTTYKASLKQYVAAIRARGGNAVLITPMHRRTFDENGKIINSHGDYPEAVRQAATEEKIPVIDLTAMSKDFYEALGKENSGAAFKAGDGTHHNNYGAYELAKMIVEAIRKNKIGVAKYLMKTPKFDPSKPDAVETFDVPPSPTAPATKPLGN